MARPSKYDEKYLPIVSKLALTGLIDKQIANILGVSRSTLSKWKKEHAEFSDALKGSKDIPDSEVVNSLYQQAIGGNVTACIFWLKNRRPADWREKPEGNEAGESIADSLKEIADKLPV